MGSKLQNVQNIDFNDSLNKMKITSNAPEVFEGNSLNDLNFHLNKMKRNNIDQIILTVLEGDQAIQAGRKWTTYLVRFKNQDQLEAKNIQKIGTYDDSAQQKWNAGSVAVTISAAIISGAFQMPSMQMFGQGASKGFDTMSHSLQQSQEGERVRKEHLYRLLDSIGGDLSQSTRGIDQNQEKIVNLIADWIRNQNRLAELVISNQ